MFHERQTTSPCHFCADGDDCSYTLYLEEGNRTEVTSPGFPNGYDRGETCRWTVSSDPHRRVRLTVNTLELYNYYQCTSDNITVYDGTYA